MTKEEKNQVIAGLTEELNTKSNFYLTNIEGLSAAKTSGLRRAFYKEDVSLKVVKNSLLRKAMEKSDKDFEEMYDVLVGNTAIAFTEIGNAPAKAIKDFRKKDAIPAIKAAYVEQSVYIGDENLEALVNIKSKDELIGEIIGLLQSPAKNVISALQSGGNKLSGIVKTLSER